MPSRIVILGNSGAGKTTLARRLASGLDAQLLSLDTIAWNGGPERVPPDKAGMALRAFMQAHPAWIVEGCYASLARLALARATALVFLNPGIETCIAHCMQRPWEPDKYPTSSAQQAMRGALLTWVREYPERTDDCGITAHRRLFDSYPGPKQELVHTADYDGCITRMQGN